MTNIPSNLLSSATTSVSQITGQVQQVTSTVQTLSAGAQARLAVIEQAIPDKLFTIPTASINLSGSLDLEKIELQVEEKVNSTAETLKNGIPDIPDISLGGLLGVALDQLPQKLEIPNLAEIKELVYNKLKKIRKDRRKSIAATQIDEAKKEETPFTARVAAKNAKNQALLNQIRGLYG